MTKIAIIENKSYSLLSEKLEKLGFECIKSFTNKNLPLNICEHTDLSLAIINNIIIVSREAYNYYNKLFSKFNIDILVGEEILSDKYPFDVKYNILQLKNYIFHNQKYTDNFIKENFKDDYVFVNVKQGYTRCSVAKINEEKIITSDIEIHEKANKLGLESLLIRHGYIDLVNYDYGFIGGATGCSKEYFFLTGNLNKHPDKNKIINFVEKTGKTMVYLSSKPIFDVGTIMIFEE